MTAGEPTLLVRYARSGGRPPSDAELLEVAPDGAWTARRTVSGRRAGRFAGQLEPEALAALADLVAAVTGSGDTHVPTPRHGATEAVDVDGATLTQGSNEDAPGDWRPLVERLRAIVTVEAVESPVAALGLEASTDRARLVHLGTEAVRLEPASLEVRVVRVAADGASLGEWAAPAAEPVAGPAGIAEAGPGWSLDLPFGHGLAPAPGDVLQVRVLLRVRDGGARTVRLYAPVRDRDAR